MKIYTKTNTYFIFFMFCQTRRVVSSNKIKVSIHFYLACYVAKFQCISLRVDEFKKNYCVLQVYDIINLCSYIQFFGVTFNNFRVNCLFSNYLKIRI